jgi:HemY protein
MRALIWIIALFALAVALTVAARYNSGFLLLVMSGYRIELSVNLAVVLLLLAFLVFYAVLRTVVIALEMPRRAAEYRKQQDSVRARKSLENSLCAYFEGRYGRAERGAAQAAAAGEWPALSLAVAARSAHELRNFSGRDAYLEQMEGGQRDGYLRDITRAELLLDERRYHDALRALERLPDRHTGALKLELRAQQLAKNWDQVLALLPQLEKRKVMDATVLGQLRRYALTENLKRKALDARSLREYWEKLAPADRKDTRVASAAAQCFIALDGCGEAHRIIEESLAESWDSTLLPLYVECLPRDARKHLERAEEWLREHPGDPVLLLALGLLCMQQSLWGKARSYLEASLAIEPGHTAYVKLGELLERMGKADEASQVYRRGLDLALAQLKEATGGRRKPAL